MKIAPKAREALLSDWARPQRPSDVLTAAYGSREQVIAEAFQANRPTEVVLAWLDIYSMGRTPDQVRAKVQQMEVM